MTENLGLNSANNSKNFLERFLNLKDYFRSPAQAAKDPDA